MAYIGIDANGVRYKIAEGNFSTSAPILYNIDIGFKPKYLIIYPSNENHLMVYNEKISTTKYKFTDVNIRLTDMDLLDSDNFYLYSINNNGFSFRGSYSSSVSWKYLAIG